MYIQTSRKKGSRQARAMAIVCGGGILVVVALQILMPHFFPALAATIVRPFWRIEFSIMSGSLSSPQAMLAENEALKIKLQELETENSSADALKQENSDLLSLLGRPGTGGSAASSTALAPGLALMSSTAGSSSAATGTISLSSIVPTDGRLLGAVLVRPPFAPYDELIIDVGSNEGVALGAPVYAPGNILIGTTTDVLGETSKVTLFSSPGETYPVLVGPQHVPATAVGRGGGQYEAQIPQATQIAQGDIVSDATLSDGPFGTVVAVIDNPSDPFESILFSPPVNIYELRFVLVGPSDAHSSTSLVSAKAKK